MRTRARPCAPVCRRAGSATAGTASSSRPKATRRGCPATSRPGRPCSCGSTRRSWRRRGAWRSPR
eukprot:8894702-Heterocapsa_arctica.AAC.1